MSDLTPFLIDHGGPVLFAVVLAEQAGLPLPSAPWLLAAGALSASGGLSLLVAIAVTTAACLIADSVWFYVGRWGGDRVLRLFCRLSLSRHSCVGRTKSLFVRHGKPGLFVAKFLPGLGTVMPPLAGVFGISARQFLLIDGAGSLFYGAFYILGGFFFHRQLERIMAALNELGLTALLVALVVILGYVALKLVRRRASSVDQRGCQGRGANPSDMPAEHLRLAEEDPARRTAGVREQRLPAAGVHHGVFAFPAPLTSPTALPHS